VVWCSSEISSDFTNNFPWHQEPIGNTTNSDPCRSIVARDIQRTGARNSTAHTTLTERERERERERLMVNTRKKYIQITLVAIYIHSQAKSHTKSTKRTKKDYNKRYCLLTKTSYCYKV
jgi:hypothetical protein